MKKQPEKPEKSFHCACGREELTQPLAPATKPKATGKKGEKEAKGKAADR